MSYWAERKKFYADFEKQYFGMSFGEYYELVYIIKYKNYCYIGKTNCIYTRVTQHLRDWSLKKCASFKVLDLIAASNSNFSSPAYKLSIHDIMKHLNVIVVFTPNKTNHISSDYICQINRNCLFNGLKLENLTYRNPFIGIKHPVFFFEKFFTSLINDFGYEVVNMYNNLKKINYKDCVL